MRGKKGERVRGRGKRGGGHDGEEGKGKKEQEEGGRGDLFLRGLGYDGEGWGMMERGRRGERGKRKGGEGGGYLYR